QPLRSGIHTLTAGLSRTSVHRRAGRRSFSGRFDRVVGGCPPIATISSRRGANAKMFTPG
ncbi:hypothetical protein ABLN64_08105, partial [Mycobacterium tuberculosis]